MPVGVVGLVAAANPEVVGHDVRHQVERVILVHSPVRPVQGVVGCDHGFLDAGVGGEIFVDGRACGVRDVEERV